MKTKHLRRESTGKEKRITLCTCGRRHAFYRCPLLHSEDPFVSCPVCKSITWLPGCLYDASGRLR